MAILMSQSPETAIAHCAVYKAGGVAVPLFVLFGPEALEYRLKVLLRRCWPGADAALQDSGAKVIVVEPSSLDVIQQLRSRPLRLRATMP